MDDGIHATPPSLCLKQKGHKQRQQKAFHLLPSHLPNSPPLPTPINCQTNRYKNCPKRLPAFIPTSISKTKKWPAHLCAAFLGIGPGSEKQQQKKRQNSGVRHQCRQRRKEQSAAIPLRPPLHPIIIIIIIPCIPLYSVPLHLLNIIHPQQVAIIAIIPPIIGSRRPSTISDHRHRRPSVPSNNSGLWTLGRPYPSVPLPASNRQEDGAATTRSSGFSRKPSSTSGPILVLLSRA
jgi:hypothetical protein